MTVSKRQPEANRKNEVRVSLTEYTGRSLVDFRVYYENDCGEFRPTRKGLCLSIDMLPRLRAAVEKADTTMAERQSNSSQSESEVMIDDQERLKTQRRWQMRSAFGGLGLPAEASDAEVAQAMKHLRTVGWKKRAGARRRFKHA